MPFVDDHYEDDHYEDDPNAPLERDLLDAGDQLDDEGDLTPCPSCGAQVYEESQKCPQCGEWIVPRLSTSKNPVWILAAILAILAMILLSI
jgi:hypothetical protein